MSAKKLDKIAKDALAKDAPAHVSTLDLSNKYDCQTVISMIGYLMLNEKNLLESTGQIQRKKRKSDNTNQ